MKTNSIEEMAEEFTDKFGNGECENGMFFPDDKTKTTIDWLKQALTKAKEQGIDEGWSSTKLLRDRIKSWDTEWHVAFPERKLTTPDTLELIKWKMCQVEVKAKEQGAREREEYVANYDMDVMCKLIDWYEKGGTII